MIFVTGQSPALFCEVVQWVVRHCMVCCLVPPVLTVLCRRFQWLQRRKRSFWIFREDMACASLQTMVVNCQKRAVDVPEGTVG